LAPRNQLTFSCRRELDIVRPPDLTRKRLGMMLRSDTLKSDSDTLKSDSDDKNKKTN